MRQWMLRWRAWRRWCDDMGGLWPALCVNLQWCRQWGMASAGWHMHHVLAQYKLALLREDHIDAVVILTVPHTLYVASLLQRSLAEHGIRADIITREPEGGFEQRLHFVIASQAFKRLPQVYVVYQMEQSVSTAWFRPKHRKKLHGAVAVMDYSRRNMHFLQQNGFAARPIFYVPVAQNMPIPSLPEVATEYDVVFYGDTNNARRQAYLKALSSRFSLKIINGLYGEAMTAALRRAKVVVNIHYYEDALLETTRIYECLANNLLVVSECSSDMAEHAVLQGLVDFVPVDDIEAMCQSVAYWLADDRRRLEHIRRQEQTLHQADNPFKPGLQALLQHLGIINADTR